MTENTTPSKKKYASVLTPKFRVSFPAVFEAKLPPGKTDAKDAKYGITMLFQTEGPDAVDITPLKALVRDVLAEKFGADKAKWPVGLRLPFRKGEEKDYEGYGKGVTFCRATARYDRKPGLVDADVKPIIDPNKFYGGCYARATISAYYYDNTGNKGVAFGLQNVQKICDGEAFSGRTKPENDFDKIATPAGSPMDNVESGSEDPLGL